MPFEMESLRALHIVLAAAFVGFSRFCASHAWACWSKRQQGRGTAQQRWPWPLIGLVGLVLIAAGWMDDHQLVRREGVIAGDSFHVVRAREDASATELPAAAGEVEGPARCWRASTARRWPSSCSRPRPNCARWKRRWPARSWRRRRWTRASPWRGPMHVRNGRA